MSQDAPVPGPRPDLWLLLGPRTPGTYPSRDVQAFREAFGHGCVAVSDELIIGVNQGRLILRDLNGRPLSAPRVVYPRLSMQDDRRVPLVAHLAAMGSVVVNSIEARRNCGNKFLTLQLLAQAGLPVPETYTYVDAPLSKVVASPLPNPCVVKAVRGSQGSRVFRASREMLKDLYGCLRVEHPYLFQRFHSFRAGSDLRVVVVDGRAVGAEVRANDQSFKSNLARGGIAEPCLGRYPDGERLACRAAAVVGADIAGVDLLFEADGGFTICEVNTAPGTKVLDTVTPAIIAACQARITRAISRAGASANSAPQP